MKPAPGTELCVTVDGASDGYLHGWAVYPGRPDRAVILQVRLNGSAIGHVLAACSASSPLEGHRFRLKLPVAKGPQPARLALHALWGGPALAIGRVAIQPETSETGWLAEPLPALPVQGDDALRAEGGVLAIFLGHLIGWARYCERPDVPVLLDILVDGAPRAAVRTGIGPRVGLPGLDGGDSAGFAIPLEAMGPAGAMAVRVAATGAMLWQQHGLTPELVIRPAAIPASAAPMSMGASLAPPRPGPMAIAAEQPAPAPGKAEVAYRKWLAQHDAASPLALDRARAMIAAGAAPAPSISLILVAPENAMAVDGAALARSLASVAAQILPPLEVLAPAAWSLPATVRAVTAPALGDLVAAATGGLVAFLTVGDRLSPVAILAMALTAREAAEAILLYSDEDSLSEESGTRQRPYFKGAPDLNLALAQDYLCRFAMMPVAAARRVAGARQASEHGLCLAITEHVLRAGLPAEIIHLPWVLYHRATRIAPDRAADLALAHEIAALLGATQTGVRATRDAMPPPEVRLEGGMRRIVWPLPARLPLVSVVIPTRDRLDLLRQCVTGLLEETAYDAIEVIIMDNESAEPATLAYLAGLIRDPRVRVVPFAGPFDFAQMNNVAARLATGPMLLLLNNDIQVLNRDWLAEMVRHLLCPRVGAVGARLLYADGRIQHAGIALGVGGIASHTYKGQPGNAHGHGNRLRAAHEVAAVTAACMLVRREAWAEVGGFATDFPVAYNDVDLCLKLRKFGWSIVLTPFACLNHLESASRGGEDTPEKKARFIADKLRMQERWSRELVSDPFLGPNWSLTSTDAVPATPPRATLPW